MSKSWHTPRVGPKTNVRPSGPHKQKNRKPWEEWDEEDTLLHQIDDFDTPTEIIPSAFEYKTYALKYPVVENPDAIDEYALAEDPTNVGAWDHYDPILIERVKKGPPPKP
jgi:hypothetical protein